MDSIISAEKIGGNPRLEMPVWGYGEQLKVKRHSTQPWFCLVDASKASKTLHAQGRQHCSEACCTEYCIFIVQPDPHMAYRIRH